MELLLLLALLPFSAFMPQDGTPDDSAASDDADNPDLQLAKFASAAAAAPDPDQDLTGGSGNDDLVGGSGDDKLTGRGGRDVLHGNGGDDQLAGGAGDDTAFGGSGNDVASLGDGADRWGLSGLYTAVDEAGNDVVQGGGGADRIVDDLGANTLIGGTGHDFVDGTRQGRFDALSDRLQGGDGDDTLVGDNGDTLIGGSGADTYYIVPGGAPVIINGATPEHIAGNGADLVVVSLPQSMMDSLDHLWSRTANQGHDREVMLGDQVIAVVRGAGASGIDLELEEYSDPGLYDGPNLINGSGAGDFLFAGYGDDTMNAGAGNDFVHDSLGNDSVRLGTGDDEFHGADVDGDPDNDTILGEAGNDHIYSNLGADELRGNDGSDWLDATDDAGQAGPQADVLKGAAGNDTLYGDDGDSLVGGGDTDRFEVLWQPGSDPVTISDLGAGAVAPEELRIFLVPGTTDDFTVVVRADHSGSDVYVAGELAVRLDGVTDPLNMGTITLEAYPDSLTPDLTGTAGNDVMGLWGNATLASGLAGDDRMYIDDSVTPTGDYDLSGGTGNDTLEGGTADGTLSGDAGDDSLWDNGADTLYGGDGNDNLYLEGTPGDMTPIDGLADGGAGNDHISTDSAGVTLTGGAGTDRFDIDYTENALSHLQPASTVKITDFDPLTETLHIDTTPIESSWTDLNLTATLDGTGTIVRLGTRQIAVLQGVDPATVPLSAITVNVLSPF